MLDATAIDCLLLLYYYRGLFSSGAKSCGPKKKSGAKITIIICLKDKGPKMGLGGCWSLEDVGV